MEFDYYDKNDQQELESPAGGNDGLNDLLLMDSQSPSYFQTAPTGSIKIVNFGQIESLLLPKDWQPLPAKQLAIGEPLNIGCTLPNNGNFSLREKGHRISEETGSLFRKTLEQSVNAKTGERAIYLNAEPEKKTIGAGEKPTSVIPKEYLALFPVLAEDLANTNKFNAELVRVRTVNDRQVLEVIGSRGYRNDRGAWTSSDQKVCSIYIDKFGKGDAIQEIRLEADKKSFLALQKELDEALKSIKWKDIPVPVAK